MKERMTTEPADNREDINTVQPDKDNSVNDLKTYKPFARLTPTSKPNSPGAVNG